MVRYVFTPYYTDTPFINFGTPLGVQYSVENHWFTVTESVLSLLFQVVSEQQRRVELNNCIKFEFNYCNECQ